MLGFGPKGYFMTLGVRAGGNLHLILMKLMTIFIFCQCETMEEHRKARGSSLSLFLKIEGIILASPLQNNFLFSCILPLLEAGGGPCVWQGLWINRSKSRWRSHVIETLNKHCQIIMRYVFGVANVCDVLYKIDRT